MIADCIEFLFSVLYMHQTILYLINNHNCVGSSSLMWRTASSWKTTDRPLSRRSIQSTDDFADDLGRRRCTRRHQGEPPATVPPPGTDILSFTSLRLDSALQAPVKLLLTEIEILVSFRRKLTIQF
jgi:hypothetical protein